MAFHTGRSKQVWWPLGARFFAVFMISAVLVTVFAIWQTPRAKARGDRAPMLFGPAKAMGAGTARAYVALQGGLPYEIGVELTAESLQRLPAHGPAIPGQHMMVKHVLDLPREAKITPFKFVELDWNPHGHEPDGIYNRPHFDFHFFTITKAERDAIDPSDPGYIRKAEHLPRPELIPSGYFPAGSLANCLRYHPTSYNVRHDQDARMYRVSLSSFELRRGGVLDTSLR